MTTSRVRPVVILAAVAVVALVTVAIAVRRGADDASPSSTTRAASTTTHRATTSSTSAPARPSTTATGSAPSSTTATTATTSMPVRTTTTEPAAATTTTVTTGPAIVVDRGPSDRRVVTLTFDAGSDRGSTAEILDSLARNGIHATFGITGRWAEAEPSLLRRIVADGHQVVNHSYDHPSFTGASTGEAPLSRSARIDQLARADAAIRRATGVGTAPWFRPPYGDQDASVRADVGSVGYRYELMWTVDSLGWKGLAASDVVQRCLDRAVPGAIYLFHVGEASTDHAALQRIIDGLRSQGYRFATAAALIR